MSVLSPYILPIKGLKLGQHEYTYKVGDEFFTAFPESPVKKANLDLSILVDKKYGELTIHFDFAGTIATECDRCLAGIDLPVEGSDTLLVQVTTENDMVSDDPQLVYISPDTFEFNMGIYAYEFMLLSLPMIRTFDCRGGELPYPCDEEMLDNIEKEQDAAINTPTDEKAPSPWDVLKNLNTGK